MTPAAKPTPGSGLQWKTSPVWRAGGSSGHPAARGRGLWSGAVGPGLCGGFPCGLLLRQGFKGRQEALASPHTLFDPPGHPVPVIQNLTPQRPTVLREESQLQSKDALAA